ncbi:N-acetylglucosamine-6-phosphate deacetylase [Anaerorhabdus furcosa]|uniref:N-acetylglucosamine-6-phosphate deacetylase n=1 Tax=Anaerorhabdus furcosa TaxID=118967 RepID=A0A1T4MVI6_9FIRM|nr:N-acetylglucosamine-6-phosphate deacetylase [Anaerorhabdus furcosa]SJZ71130.1 N-acetylglucosamine-6-phosphate deacetylase [Anaerorhabdus furcosa]
MIIQSTRVWIDEKFQSAQLEIKDNKIVGIHEYNKYPVDTDYKDERILPGLLDIHAHGFNGMDSNYATADGLKHWIASLPKEGVTSFLVTTSTAPEANLLESYELISKVIDEKLPGATPLGIHVEGPQISFDFKGAHNPYLIQKPNVEQFKRYQEHAQNKIKLICIAPEMDENHELIKYCVNNNVKVTLGHTGAKYDECVQAMHDGARSFTHTFNGMLGVHHREPGSAGAALALDDMYAELICDGVHVHYAVAKTVVRAKGKDKLILVTDAVQIKGLKPGIYDMPGRWVEVKEDGCGRLKDGRLAGSSNKMITMLKNCIEHCDAEEVVAINAATKNPARFLGLDTKGEIKLNNDADVIVIDDTYQVIQTYINGNPVL